MLLLVAWLFNNVMFCVERLMSGNQSVISGFPTSPTQHALNLNQGDIKITCCQALPIMEKEKKASTVQVKLDRDVEKTHTLWALCRHLTSQISLILHK